MPRSVSVVACAELPAPICLFLLQISTLHRFQRLLVTLKPSGGPTLISPNGMRVSAFTCTHNTHASPQSWQSAQDTERHTVLIFLASCRKKEFASYTMSSLCESAIILTSNTFKVVITGILAFYFNVEFWWTSRERISRCWSALCSDCYQMSFTSWTVECSTVTSTLFISKGDFVLMLIIQFHL